MLGLLEEDGAVGDNARAIMANMIVGGGLEEVNTDADIPEDKVIFRRTKDGKTIAINPENGDVSGLGPKINNIGKGNGSKSSKSSAASGASSSSKASTSTGGGASPKKYISTSEASSAKKIGGYTRKNTFKNGYGNTRVSDKDKATRAGITAAANMNDAGEWTEEREALHSEIIDNAFAGVKKPEGKPTTTFMGGGPSSGKSYVVKAESKNLNLPNEDERVLVDPDKCKHPLPEYDPNDPEPVHEESSGLAKRITQIAQENGYNVLVDGTGDGDKPEKMRKKIQQAKDAGQTVNGVYVFKPIEDAICSNFARERTVDQKMLVETHQNISRILPEIAPDFDNVKLYANMKQGQPPVLIAEGGGGKPLKILDQKMYDLFLKNADYEYDEERINYLKGLPQSQKKH